MWLIDTKTLVLKEVISAEDIRYVTLSHTWEAEEVDFQEMRFQQSTAMKKKGFDKITRTCRLAREREIPYAWIDTCCIDKTSSAALSEAINSMFKWYAESFICFTYLSDLSVYDLEHNKSGITAGFLNSRWFTRGWTLQELIAPEIIYFYDSDWKFLGTKDFFRREISSLTGIDIEVLQNSKLLPTIPVGRRMSWASKRKTTRVEDIAYCLLGIFDVNMPMIYGEGTKAFFRLQEEIMKNVNDLSLFAWTAQDEARHDRQPTNINHYREGIRGILARSPAEFMGCRNLRNFSFYTSSNDEFSMTNKGLKMHKVLSVGPDEDYVLGLECTVSLENGNKRQLGVRLKKTETGYVRSHAYEIFMANLETFREGQLPLSTVYIEKEVTLSKSLELQNRVRCSFQFNLPSSYKVYSIRAHPESRWDPHGMFFLTSPRRDRKFTGCLEFFLEPRGWKFLIVCGLATTTGELVVYDVWATILSDHDPSSKAQMDIVTALIEAGDELSLEEIRNEVLGCKFTWDRDFSLRPLAAERKVAYDIEGEMVYYLRRMETSILEVVIT
jgi:hypothetical protein